MNADEIADRIASRYAKDRGWLVIREAQPPTPAKETARRYDAVAVSLWGSMGSVVHGFEIKVARSDWRAELLNPSKSAALAKHCDYWWVVAPKDVVQVAEAPTGWGVLHVSGNGLRVGRQAEQLKPTREESFWQFLLSRCVYRTDRDEAAQLRTLTARIVADQGKSADRDASHEVRALGRLREQVDAFEKASGVRIDGYAGSGTKAAELMRAFADGEHKRVLRNVASARSMLRTALAATDKVAAHLGAPDEG